MKKKNTNMKSSLTPAQNLDSVFDDKKEVKKKDLMTSKIEEVKDGDKKHSKGYKLHRRTSSTDKKGAKGGKKGRKGSGSQEDEVE